MESPETPLTLAWAVRALYTGAVVAYAAHLWLVWRQVRTARIAMFGLPPARQVTVRAEVLMHGGEAFLFRDVISAPDE